MTALLWLLLLAPLAAALLAQQHLQSVFDRYRRVPNRARLTGAELARALLDAHGLRRVRLELAPGFLTDHYDGERNVLRLSRVVANERSVAALGIAAHEVSHAYQVAEGSRAYQIRRRVGEPLAKVAPWSGVTFLGGFWFGIPVLMVLSIAFAAGVALFALVTLPVEIGATRRAVDLLRATGLAGRAEVAAIQRVLRAAGLTYVVGVLRQLGFLFALVLLADAIRRVST